MSSFFEGRELAIIVVVAIIRRTWCVGYVRTRVYNKLYLFSCVYTTV